MKFFLSLLVLACSVTALAQPTLTHWNMRPDQSTTLNFLASNSSVDNEAGEGVTWDNSNLIGAGSVSYTCINPLWTPFSKDFNNASWALETEETIIYYDNADSSLVYYGGSQGNDVVYYNDPAEYYSFPYTDGSTSYDEYLSNYSVQGVDITRSGEISTTANGWGTVILPNGTYEDVLRVEVDETLIEESLIGTTTIELTYVTFIHPETGFWVLQYGDISITDPVNGTQEFEYAQYLESVDLGIDQPSEAEVKIDLFPNPAQNEISVSNFSPGSLYHIFNIQGEHVASGLLTNHPIDISEFAPGTYSMSVVGKFSVTSELFIKQ